MVYEEHKLDTTEQVTSLEDLQSRLAELKKDYEAYYKKYHVDVKPKVQLSFDYIK